MWVLRSNRTQLIEFFKGGAGDSFDAYAPSYVESLPNLPCDSNEFYIVWSSQPSKNCYIPIAIIIDKEHQRDFFAWSLTYLSQVSPLSAYCRIIDPTTFNNLVGCAPENIKLPESAYISMIIAELLGYFDGSQANLNSTCGNIYSSTYSFARTRAKFYNYRNILPSDLSNAWLRTRSISNKKLNKDNLVTLDEIWACLDAFDNDFKGLDSFSPVGSFIVSALEEYSIKGSISPAILKNLLKI